MPAAERPRASSESSSRRRLKLRGASCVGGLRGDELLTVHARCVAGKPKKNRSFLLVAVDAVALDTAGLEGKKVLCSKAKAKPFLCCEPVVLPTEGWQDVSLQVRPLTSMQFTTQSARTLVGLVQEDAVFGTSWHRDVSWSLLDSETAVHPALGIEWHSPTLRSLLRSLGSFGALLKSAIGPQGQEMMRALRAAVEDRLLPHVAALVLQDIDADAAAGAPIKMMPVGRLPDGSSAFFAHEGVVGTKFAAWGAPDAEGDGGDKVPLEQIAKSISGFPILFTQDLCLGPDLEAAAGSKGAVPILSVLRDALGDLVRDVHASAHQRDLDCLRRGWRQSEETIVGLVDDTDSFRLDVEPGHRLLPGDDIMVDGEFNRVRQLGSVITSFPVEKTGADTVKVNYVVNAPIPISDTATAGKTFEFILNVEVFDPEREEAKLSTFMRQYCDNENKKWPPANTADEQKERKRLLTWLYSTNSVYSSMNRAMYMNDAEGLKKHAPYIRALRRVFLSGQPDPVVQPFVGRVTRCMNIPLEMVHSDYMEVGRHRELVCWSAFTSTSVEAKGGNSGFGQVLFKLHLSEVKDGAYAPACISQYSQYPSENEVLVPPHCMFRVINVDLEPRVVVHMELQQTDSPLVWDLISSQDWGGVAQWIERNKGMCDTRNSKYSLICEIGAAAKGLDASVALTKCIENKANVNEVSRQSGCTALALIAESTMEDTGKRMMLRQLIAAGAHSHIKGPGGKSLADIMPDELDSLVADEKGTPRWWYFVDDGVDAKTAGWYPYSEEATPIVERIYKEWACDHTVFNDLQRILDVKSGTFVYSLVFAEMLQRNRTTGKPREIRRTCVEMKRLEKYCPCGARRIFSEEGVGCEAEGCTEPFIPVKNIFHG